MQSDHSNNELEWDNKQYDVGGFCNHVIIIDIVNKCEMKEIFKLQCYYTIRVTLKEPNLSFCRRAKVIFL